MDGWICLSKNAFIEQTFDYINFHIILKQTTSYVKKLVITDTKLLS